MRDVDAIDAAIAVTGLPCVIKPVDLAASRGVIRADDRAEVHAAVRRTSALMREICAGGSLPPLLVESYIDGVEVALEGLVREGFLEVDRRLRQTRPAGRTILRGDAST